MRNMQRGRPGVECSGDADVFLSCREPSIFWEGKFLRHGPLKLFMTLGPWNTKLNFVVGNHFWLPCFTPTPPSPLERISKSQVLSGSQFRHQGNFSCSLPLRVRPKLPRNPHFHLSSQCLISLSRRVNPYSERAEVSCL